MLASLQPKYTFTDGPAYVIGTHSKAKNGTKVPVYIPSLMPNIEKTTGKPMSKSEKSATNTIFANTNRPNMKGTVKTTNYVYAKSTGGFILDTANDKLIEDYRKGGLSSTGYKQIHYIPDKADIKSGKSVYVRSNTGCFRDLFIS